MIPKIIHYCWFGRNPKPQLAEKCLTSWKKYCPEYEIKEWNEDTYDLSQAPLYVRQAYEAKRWAFVTDYVRLQVVYEHGGIYLDTDVELVRSPDEFLGNSAFFGFEGDYSIATGLGFGAEKEADILKELMADYQGILFILDNGEMDLTPCPERNTEVFLRKGLKLDGTRQVLEDGTLILSAEYLCPLDNATRILRKTKNTISIHHFDASWQPREQKEAHDKLARQRRMSLMKSEIIYFPRKLMRKLIGNKMYESVKKKIKDICSNV